MAAERLRFNEPVCNRRLAVPLPTAAHDPHGLPTSHFEPACDLGGGGTSVEAYGSWRRGASFRCVRCRLSAARDQINRRFVAVLRRHLDRFTHCDLRRAPAGAARKCPSRPVGERGRVGCTLLYSGPFFWFLLSLTISFSDCRSLAGWPGPHLSYRCPSSLRASCSPVRLSTPHIPRLCSARTSWERWLEALPSTLAWPLAAGAWWSLLLAPIS